MRIANLAGRLVVVADDGERAIDVERSSSGRFSSDPQLIYSSWGDFASWASVNAVTASADVYDPGQLLAPVPYPSQVFAIGLNYHDHAQESAVPVPDQPMVFTKFPSSITEPSGNITLPEGSVDWEAEIVVVIGEGGRNIAAPDAWAHVAGLMLGQDISERRRQQAGPRPQFSLAKSFAGFSPIGPFVATADEFDDPASVGFGCSLDGEVMQDGRTSGMIFDVPTLIDELSRVIELKPGDLIFTGTPSGVGAARKPPQFIQPGSELVTYGDRLGSMRHKFT